MDQTQKRAEYVGYDKSEYIEFEKHVFKEGVFFEQNSKCVVGEVSIRYN